MTMTIATAALRLQELCDSIAAFLKDTPETLRSYALVCSTFASCAQRHLFHDIILNRGCQAFHEFGIRSYAGDEARACRRLCSVLRSSPHLIPLIRRLRICLAHEVLEPLTEVVLPNLGEVLLDCPLGLGVNAPSMTLAALLISVPSLRRVGLRSFTFRSIRDIHHLFQNGPPALESLSFAFVKILDTRKVATGSHSYTKIKALTAHGYHEVPDWLFDHGSPFDLSELAELTYSCDVASTAIRALELLDSAHLSLTRLVIILCPCRTVPFLLFPLPRRQPNHDYSSAARHDVNDLDVLDLGARFPFLAHLTLQTRGLHPELVEIFSPAGKRLDTLSVAVRVQQPDILELQELAAACANKAKSVTVSIDRPASQHDDGNLAAIVRMAFEERDKEAFLDVVICGRSIKVRQLAVDADTCLLALDRLSL
ncbi:hypothetical protein B0H11DRAFT_167536 [Mycena galericulata]|nr:hypothetical protein B0H11DRAFT_167536 [Mycena galericulata]